MINYLSLVMVDFWSVYIAETINRILINGITLNGENTRVYIQERKNKQNLNISLQMIFIIIWWGI